MHRRPLLELLDRYEQQNPTESACIERIRELVRKYPTCFERTCLPGHITASAWIVSADRSRFLLTHHRKLGRWLQLGGHADGDEDVFAVALREAREESGLQAFEWLSDLPIDVDVHRIPARADEPAHEHHDIRFLLVAGSDQEVAVSDESHALEWFGWDALRSDFDEESLLRLGRKARQQLFGQ
ncbi:MAG: NUDIX hydrolase [Myxococcota bacterium]|nr:NUDIX hydrolase [Myxococcota bacterium]